MGESTEEGSRDKRVGTATDETASHYNRRVGGITHNKKPREIRK